MNGYAQKRIDRLAWEIALVDRHTRTSYTIQFTCHENKKPENQLETTFINDDGHSMEIMKALAEALTQMGLMPISATDSELKATKYHLEDMRKLAKL